jgi:hypothetical protein
VLTPQPAQQMPKTVWMEYHYRILHPCDWTTALSVLRSKLGDFRFQLGTRRDQPFRPDLGRQRVLPCVQAFDLPAGQTDLPPGGLVGVRLERRTVVRGDDQDDRLAHPVGQAGLVAQRRTQRLEAEPTSFSGVVPP